MEHKNKMISSVFRPNCALSGFVPSLNKSLAEAKNLRFSCSQTDVIIILSISISICAALYAIKSPLWVKNTPILLGLFYSIIWVPLRYSFDNSNHMAWLASGFSKNEYVNLVTSDQRTRLTVAASLTAAVIVSLNAWISRWESKN